MILVLILLMMLISSRLILQAIANTTRDLQETLLDQLMSSDCGACSDPENYVRDFIDEIEPEYDSFENFHKWIKKFVEDLQIFRQDSKESFCFFVLYRAIYALLEKKDSFAFCEDEKEIESVIGSEFFARLKEKQDEFYLDLNISIF